MKFGFDRFPGASVPLGLRLWRDWIAPYRLLIVANLVLIAGVASATATYPLLIRWALDRFQANDLAPLRWVPWLVILVTAIKGATLYGQSALTNVIASRVVRDLQNAIFKHLITADLLQLQLETPAALTQRFTTDLTYVREAVARGVSSLVRDTLMVVALGAAMIWIDWKLAAAGLVLLPIAAWPVAEVGRRLRQNARRMQERSGGMSSMVDESLAGARMVKTYGLESYVATRAGEAFTTLHEIRVHAANQFARVEPIMEVLGGLAVAGVLCLVGWRLSSGAGSAMGDFAGFLAALLIAAQPMRALGNVHAVIQEGLAAAERVFALLDRKPAIVDRPDAAVLQLCSRTIRFERVGFCFAPDQFVLREVDFEIPDGKTFALIGRSGSGKSTMLNLLARLYEASEGTVRIDGQDVREVTLASLRESMALVSQDVIVFDDTVAVNLAFGRPGATLPEIEAAARVAAAHDFIMALPQGYHTRLGAQGSRLSGGERQRLALARAVLRDAPILLLDEATSALDAESEHLVQAALQKVAAGRTTLIVAHRLATVRHADCILVLEGGRIAESGSHEALLARGGIYAGLHQRQLPPGSA